MDKRLSFNEDEKNYDKYRPKYCRELFNSITNYIEEKKDIRALEIGIGTGQATKPFLDEGFQVTAVEIGDKLAAYTRDKYKRYDKFSVENKSFEKIEIQDESMDLVYSATAFHWIDEELGFKKTLKLLKEGGTLALFWNKPSGKIGEQLFEDIQKAYRKHLPQWNSEKDNWERIKDRNNMMKKYGLESVETHIFEGTRKMSADEYINLLNTYSDHRSLEECKREALYQDIRDAINRHGGEIIIYDTMDLHLGRKPYN